MKSEEMMTLQPTKLIKQNKCLFVIKDYYIWIILQKIRSIDFLKVRTVYCKRVRSLPTSYSVILLNVNPEKK